LVKFLIIRFSSIGDIVLTSPVARIIKSQIADSKIDYLTKPEYSEILINNPNIDNLILLKPSLKETISELKLNKYDYIIDLHNNLRTRIIKSKLSVISFSFNKLNLHKWLYVNFKINRLPNKHIVDRYIDTLKLFDAINDNKGLDFFISDNNKVDLKTYINNESFLVIVVGAKHFTKQIPSEKIIEVCNKIPFKVILLGGKEDEENSRLIENACSNNIVNLCGKLNIQESASVINQSKLVITPDTGLMHIASALNKNIISLWGNTVPAFGMYPYLPSNKRVEIEITDLSCRPCSKIGYYKCPKVHFNCMNAIKTDEIISHVNIFMNNNE